MPMDLVLDHLAQPRRLGLDFDHRRVTLAERGHLLGLATHDLGVLAAQRGDGLRLHRLREGADLVLGQLQALDLIETRFCCRRAGVRHAELIVQFRKLLFVDELSAGAEDVVAGLERLDAILGLAHAILELVETRGQRLRNLPGGIGPDVRLFCQISLRNRVGEARRFGRVLAGNTDVDDVGAFGALDLELALERIQRGQSRVGAAGCRRARQKPSVRAAPRAGRQTRDRGRAIRR